MAGVVEPSYGTAERNRPDCPDDGVDASAAACRKQYAVRLLCGVEGSACQITGESHCARTADSELLSWYFEWQDHGMYRGE